MDKISPIKPYNYITDHKPRVEGSKNISAWFLDEQIELDFGDTVGRPSENVLLRTEYITRFLENGWTIDKVISKSSSGVWQSVAETETKESKDEVWKDSSDGNGEYLSIENVSHTDEKQGGAAYWASFQRIRLKRRRMQPEKVMQDMTNSFTDAYNSGRSIDNDRFNELLSLYSVVLDRNEKEANILLTKAIDASGPTDFLDRLYNSTWSDFTSAHDKAVQVSVYGETDAVNDINRQFDGLVEQTKAQMITNGTYNNTVWPSVNAGIERQRAAALVKAKSESSQAGVSALTSVASAKASASSAFLAARDSIIKTIDNRRVTASEMRNSVVKWMLDYMGTREEVYPELEEISAMAERLGFSVGSAGNVL